MSVERSGSEPTLLDRLLRRSNQLMAFGLIICGLWVAATVKFGLTNLDQHPADFLSFWAAGEMVADGSAAEVYDLEAHHEVTEILTGERSGLLPYMLTPSFLVPSTVLAFFGYTIGFIIFAGLGLAASGWIVWRITRDRLTLILSYASPTTLASLEMGHLGVLLATGASTALMDHRDRPMRAAIGLAVLSLKPQFGIAVGLALVVVRAWRTLGLGISYALGLAVISGALFGPARWVEFARRVEETNQVMADVRLQRPFFNQGLVSILQALGLADVGAWGIQLVFSVALLAVVLMQVRRHGLTPRTIAMVLTATVLISPRSFGYDFHFLVPAAALLVVQPTRPRPTTYVVIALAALLLGLAVLSFPTALIAGLLMIWLSWPTPKTEDGPEKGPGVKQNEQAGGRPGD